MNYKRVCCLLLLGFSACSLQSIATSVTPAASHCSCTKNADSVEVVVTNLGWHTGLLLATAEIPNELVSVLPKEFQTYEYVEVGWGDKDFYQSSGYSVVLGLKALFFSSGAAVHITGFSNVDQYLKNLQIVTVRISRESLKKLLMNINWVIEPHPIPLGFAMYGRGHFYSAKGNFSIFHTCNAWTEERLIEVGCNLPCRTVTSSGLITALKKHNDCEQEVHRADLVFSPQ